MEKKLKNKWMKALRSGLFRQGVGKLRNTRNGYCCLGVLAAIQGAEWVNEKGVVRCVVKGEYVDTRGVMISNLLLKPTFAGLSSSQQRELAMINDRRTPFSKIADYIKENIQ